MAKDRKKLLNIHSKIKDRQPTPSTLEYGEIAVNYKKDKEFISIKNDEDKVVRFSSDVQMIEWMEKKEVMPYSGTVDNVHLDTNRSNIEIKFNQVVAENTVKHDFVNGATDIDGDLVNPTDDEGITNGAGFAIDMSRYAMIGANPSFSSITVTHQSNLSGITNISNGAGGSVLNILTTDVNSTNTNWVETIENKSSNIEVLDESAVTRTTSIGTESLTVSGLTSEVHSGAVEITNSSDVTENNLTDKVENTTGSHKIYVTGDTCINSQSDANFYGKSSTNIGVACDGTKGSATTIYGTTTTISGNTTNVTGATTLNISGNTVNEKALTANTNVTSAYTSATTATTIIGTLNESATTASLSGSSLVINEATSISAKTPTTNLSGSSLGVIETTTDIQSCTRLSANTNALTIQECTSGSGKAIINESDIDINGATFDVVETASATIKAPRITESGATLTLDESTSISAKTPTAYISGTTLEVKETNVNISGTTKISGNTTIGGNLIIPIPCDTITSTTVNDALCEVFSRDGVTMTRVDAPDDSRLSAIYRLWQNGSQIGYDINVPKDGFLKEVKLVDVSGISYLRFTWNVYDAETQTYSTGTTDVNVEELVKQIEANNPSDNGTAANHNVAVDVWYNTTTGKMNVSASTTATMHVTNMYATGTVSAATGNITTANITTASITTANVTTGNITTLNAGATTISGAAKVNNTLTVTGNTTLANATASTLNATNVYASGTVTGATVSGTNVNGGTISGTNVNAATKVTTNALDVTGNAAITGTITAASGLSKKVTWAAGAFTANTTGYNGSADRVITVPTDASHITRKTLSVTHNGLTDTYDPGASANKSMTLPHSSLTVSFGTATAQTSNVVYNTSAAKTITIPTKITHLTNDLSNLTFATGTTSVTGSPYNGSAAKTITIPSDASHITRKTLTIQKNSSNVGSYDPGATENTTINIGVPTNVSELTNDLSYLKWSLGTPSADTTGYNGSAAKTITIPSKISNLTNDLSNLTFQTGNTSVQSPYNGSAAKTVTIPASVDNLTNYNSSTGIITLPHNVSVSGTVTATGAVYSSDRNLKDNIKPISRDDINKVGKVLTRSFNFKDDETKRKTYGVIAQDVLDAGIGEIVHTGEDGMLGVDYTSLLILKIAYLEAKLSDLEEKIKENKN